MKSRVLFFLLPFALPLSCSADESAVEECHALGVALCRALASCESGSRVVEPSLCLQHYKTSVACADAARVSESYDACMAELERRTCSQSPLSPVDPLADLPLSCVGAIELK